ncbi:guanine deaminase [Peziza echinospora]|nr:guanine deaminase [Peziza echinospora]
MPHQIPPTNRVLGKALYVGTFAHTPTLGSLEVHERSAIGVDEFGKIAFMEKEVASVEEVLGRHPEWATSGRVVRSGESGFFFPGFVDTHIHAPQFPNSGIFGSSTLLDWLEKYTFPTEDSFKDLDRARTVYDRLVNRTLSHGTTTASYFATIHVPATNLLASICHHKGQRALVGRMCMDCNAPDYLLDKSVEEAMDLTKQTIEHCRGIDPKGDLVSPVVTPRFAVSCTGDLLSALGKLAKEEDIAVQTHLSENVDEIDFVVNTLFPGCGTYTNVYDAAGLLGRRTILGHCVHLSREELELIKKRGSGISHCPVSNSSLGSGLARVRKMIDAGVEVGLGTDVSGGYSPSILEASRQAITVSRLVANLDATKAANLSVSEVLYLATLGGAHVVGLQDKVGSFEVGKEWDAIFVDLTPVPDLVFGESLDNEEAFGVVSGLGPVDIFSSQTGWEDRLAKWVFSGDDRNNLGVWVRGRLVYEKVKGVIEMEALLGSAMNN